MTGLVMTTGWVANGHQTTIPLNTADAGNNPYPRYPVSQEVVSQRKTLLLMYQLKIWDKCSYKKKQHHLPKGKAVFIR